MKRAAPEEAGLVEISLALRESSTVPEMLRKLGLSEEQIVIEKTGFDECLKFYCDSKNEIKSHTKTLKEMGAVYRVREIGNAWKEKWKEHFRPLNVGNRFRIIPVWEEKTYGRRFRMVIDPGSAFGEGTHATTKLMIRSIEKYLRQGMRVMDVGTGTGILSIAATLLGAAEVTALDLDSNSISAARKNFSLNGVTGVRLLKKNILEYRGRKTYDVVLANMISSRLIEGSGNIARLVREKGDLIVSGTSLQNQKNVETCYAGWGLSVVERSRQDGWGCIVFRR